MFGGLDFSLFTQTFFFFFFYSHKLNADVRSVSCLRISDASPFRLSLLAKVLVNYRDLAKVKDFKQVNLIYNFIDAPAEWHQFPFILKLLAKHFIFASWFAFVGVAVRIFLVFSNLQTSFRFAFHLLLFFDV